MSQAVRRHFGFPLSLRLMAAMLAVCDIVVPPASLTSA
jgi:transposase-like protein